MERNEALSIFQASYLHSRRTETGVISQSERGVRIRILASRCPLSIERLRTTENHTRCNPQGRGTRRSPSVGVRTRKVDL